MSVPKYETERNRAVIGNPVAARLFSIVETTGLEPMTFWL
jgi:hypothetical protein